MLDSEYRRGGSRVFQIILDIQNVIRLIFLILKYFIAIIHGITGTVDMIDSNWDWVRGRDFYQC